MSAKIIFITGTDTGVGKTVLSALLTSHLRVAGIAAFALKPICSGGRDDARKLRAASGNQLSLDEVNPWHFRAALAPVLAARKERQRVTRAQVVRHIQKFSRQFDVIVVEGAGGLLSPLGEDFDSRDLIAALRATPVVVCPNRLGAVNQARLVLEALPEKVARQTPVVLVESQRGSKASVTNPVLLGEFIEVKRIHLLPWLANGESSDRNAKVRRILKTVARQVLPKR